MTAPIREDTMTGAKGQQYRARIERLAAARRRRALSGAVSIFLAPVLAAWTFLAALNPLLGGLRFLPLVDFVVFWGAAAFSAVWAARWYASRSWSAAGLAATLGRSGGRGGLFLTALEFSAGEPRIGKYSPFLVAETVRRADGELDEVDAEPIMGRAGRPGWTLAAFAAALAVLAHVFATAEGTRFLLSAVSDPLVSFERRPSNNLVTSAGDIEVVSGEDVTVSVLRAGSRDDEVRVLWSDVPGVWDSEVLEPDPARTSRAGAEIFTHTFREVREDRAFRFEARDEATVPRRIAVIRRPVVNAVSAVIEYPGYMAAPPETVATLTGRLIAPEGSRVAIEGEASKELAGASLAFSGAGEVGLEAEGRTFRGSFYVDGPDTFRVDVTGIAGLTPERPPVYPVIALEDRAPAIEAISPGDGSSLPRSQIVDLVYAASDDYGLSRLTIAWRKEGAARFESARMPLPAGATLVEDTWTWSMEDLRIMPGDRVEWYLEAADNNTATGPGVTRTPVMVLVVPSLSELYAETREREEEQREGMDEIMEEGREIRDRLAELSEDVRARGEMDWSRRSEGKRLIEKHRELQEKIGEAADRLGETLDQLESNRMTSMEVGRKMEQIQSMLEKIQNEEIKAAIEKLRRMMEELSPEDVAAQMEDMEMQAGDLLSRLDRTIEALERLLDEQKMEEMMRRIEEMIERQRDIADSTGVKPDAEAADSQDELAGDFEEFESDLGELAGQKGDDSIPGLGETAESARQANIDSMMSSAAADLRSGERESASASQSEAVSEMLSLYTRLGRCQMQMSSMVDSRVTEAIERAIDELIEVSARQEAYAGRLRSARGGQAAGMTPGQFELRDAVQKITSELYNAARRSLRLPEAVFARLGLSSALMQETMDLAEVRKYHEAAMTAAAVPEQINLAVIELLHAASSSGGSGQGQGQSMQMLTGSQMEIDRQLRRMLEGGAAGMSMEQRAQMARLAAEQRRMEEMLERILEESQGAGRTLGRLDDLGEEMGEVARRLEQGDLDRDLLEREERVLSRLLESQRSLNRRDYSRRRRSRTGGDLEAREAGEGLAGDERREMLLEMIRRAMRGRGPVEYEELNRLYFRALAGEVRKIR